MGVAAQIVSLLTWLHHSNSKEFLIQLEGNRALYTAEYDSKAETSTKYAEDKFQDKEWVDHVLGSINSETIRDYLKFLSTEPNLAGSERDSYLIEYIRKEWIKQGLEHVKLATYDFLLSYPNPKHPNKVYILNEENKKVWTSRHREELDKSGYDREIPPAFHAYSPSGDVTGELVYVNYGRKEDIERLQELGVSLQGKIAIARYGDTFRGNMKTNCEAAGAIGVIMYTDPKEVAPLGVEPEYVYPNTSYLPESGIQRGTLVLSDGDPLSPGWASIKGAYRLKQNTKRDTPGGPSQPIGYGDARRLLELLGGGEVPDDWRGAIPGITYRLGPGFNSRHKGWKVRLKVNNVVETKESSNIVGMIKGSTEPDRYVYISNHRDAWGFGAVDPFSGTSVILELVRIFGRMHKKGWRPRRSLVFLSFGSEESGMEGSGEYVREYYHQIVNRAVALINIDICVNGPVLKPNASPQLKDVFLAAIKSVEDPIKDKSDSRKKTLYDTLKEMLEEGQSSDETIKILGSGSDHDAFSFYAGVPSLYYGFGLKDSHNYPMYHTGFETFHLVDKFIDPSFKLHRACGQITAHMSLNLAESQYIPFNFGHILKEVEGAMQNLENSNNSKYLRGSELGPAFITLQAKIQGFREAVVKWTKKRQHMMEEDTDELRIRALNDQATLLDRNFILNQGLPGRPFTRHVLFSPAKFDAYGASALPGIGDLLFGFEDISDTEERNKRMEELKRHLSDVMITFHQATLWLMQ